MPGPAEQATASGPTPALVRGNLWRDIPVAAIGELEPDASVSIVIDGDGDRERTVASLREQTYPAALIEIADPGTEPEISGGIVLIVPAGVVAAPTLVEAHARWHHSVCDAVTVGPVRAGGGGTDPFDLTMDLTRSFSDPGLGLHLAAACGTLGVRPYCYRGAGGLGHAPAAVRRLDLAHRLNCFGAVFVPEPDGAATGPEDPVAGAVAAALTAAATERARVDASLPAVAQLVPVPPFRPAASPRRYRRAAVVVNVAVGEEPVPEVLATVEAILGGHLGDLELRVQMSDGHPGHADVAALLAGDARASFAPCSTEDFCASPFQVTVPALALPDARTMADLHRLVIDEDVGAMHVTVPGAPPEETMIEVVRTGALARARRVAGESGEDVAVVLGRLFGERWVSGVEVSVRRHGVDEPHVTEHGPLAAATDLEHERIQHLRFQDRADDLQEKTAFLARRVLVERLRAREQRLRAERLESQLAAAGPPPRLWRLRPVRSALARLRGR